MNDRALVPHNGALVPAGVVAPDPLPRDGTVESLEERIRRLEDALAASQDTHSIEHRVTERLMGQMSAVRPGEVVPLAGSAPLPDAPEPTGRSMWWPFGRGGQRWLLFEFLDEWRLMLRMYNDPRYRVTRLAQYTPWTAGALIILAYLFFMWFTAVPIAGTAIYTVIVMAVSVVAYKILSREAQRYRERMTYHYGQRF